MSRTIWACRQKRCASMHARRLDADEGRRPEPPTSEEREEIKRLRREIYELRRANEILKAASVFFATELNADRPSEPLYR
jgi:transposase